MRTTRLLSTIAATLLLGTGAAAAQGVTGPMKPERAPSAQQNAPAEKIAPNMHAGERGTAETTGQGSTHALKPATGGKSGMKAEENSQTKAGADVKANDKSGSTTLKSERNSKEQMKGAEKDSSGAAASKSAAEKSDKAGKDSTTGQGAAASATRLTTEQRTKITTVIKKQKVKPAHLNISVRVGVRVPARVHYYPLPAEVVEVYPEWRGYDYILVGDQIVIIDPGTHAVVFIIEA